MVVAHNKGDNKDWTQKKNVNAACHSLQQLLQESTRQHFIDNDAYQFFLIVCYFALDGPW